MKNPIVEVARWCGEPAEVLFQLGRLWTEHQSPLSGSFPMEFQDSGGPLSLTDALTTGEDSAYWDMVLALWASQAGAEWGDPDSEQVQAMAVRWQEGDCPPWYDPWQAMEHIRFATRVVERWYRNQNVT